MKHSKIYLPFLLIFILFTCGTTTKHVKYDIIKHSKNQEKSDDIMKYLVAIDSYTTNGAKYHKKYEKYLIGVASILVKEKKINVKQRTIGFYFDKKSNRKNRLYFGLDINEKTTLKNSSYVKNARAMLNKYLLSTLEVLHSCVKILDENEIEGMVIGIWWKTSSKQFLNIWIKKEYVQKYYDKEITFHELVYNCTITNIEGKTIRITL